MSCKWDLSCKFIDTKKCDTCFTKGLLFQEQVQKKQTGLKQRRQKADRRLGSDFEFANHKRNTQVLLQTESNMTINSGATKRQKGDENITGYIKLMEELKTRTGEKSRGAKSFTIQREWLEKLEREARERDFEFWYLVFAFNELEGIQDKSYVTIDKTVLLNMIQSIITDRKRADLAAQTAKVSELETQAKAAEISALYSKVRYLEEKVKLLEVKKDGASQDTEEESCKKKT